MNTTIESVLYTSKTLSNGEHPLMLRLTKDRKRKYISLHLSLDSKLLFTAITAITLIAAFTSCQKDKTVSVSGVSLNKTTLNITVGDSEPLTVNVQPSNADNKTVFWSSSSPGVASVDASGKVTAVAKGSAIITVTTEDGGKTATCNVTVSPIAVSGVTLNKTTLNLTAGETETLTANVQPSNAEDRYVAWSSNAIGVASVNASGQVI